MFRHKCDFRIINHIYGREHTDGKGSFFEEFRYCYCEKCRAYKIASCDMKITGVIPDDVEDIKTWLEIKFHPVNGVGYPTDKIVEEKRLEIDIDRDFYEIKELLTETQDYILNLERKLDEYSKA